MENDITEKMERYERTINKIVNFIAGRQHIRIFDLQCILIKEKFLPKLKYDPSKNYRSKPTKDIYDI